MIILCVSFLLFSKNGTQQKKPQCDIGAFLCSLNQYNKATGLATFGSGNTGFIDFDIMHHTQVF